MTNLLLLITTESGKQNAEKVAFKILDKKLAACVSIKKINSIYRWKSKIEKNVEFEIVIKSIPSNLDLLITLLKKELSYELPQFIYKIFDSEINYFNWVSESLNQDVSQENLQD